MNEKHSAQFLSHNKQNVLLLLLLFYYYSFLLWLDLSQELNGAGSLSTASQLHLSMTREVSHTLLICKQIGPDLMKLSK